VVVNELASMILVDPVVAVGADLECNVPDKQGGDAAIGVKVVGDPGNGGSEALDGHAMDAVHWVLPVDCLIVIN
jgi:hypothetical protein